LPFKQHYASDLSLAYEQALYPTIHVTPTLLCLLAPII